MVFGSNVDGENYQTLPSCRRNRNNDVGRFGRTPFKFRDLKRDRSPSRGPNEIEQGGPVLVIAVVWIFRGFELRLLVERVSLADVMRFPCRRCSTGGNKRRSFVYFVDFSSLSACLRSSADERKQKRLAAGEAQKSSEGKEKG